MNSYPLATEEVESDDIVWVYRGPQAQSAPIPSLEDDSVLRIHVLNGFLDGDHAFAGLAGEESS